jgi:hypothetical protein
MRESLAHPGEADLRESGPIIAFAHFRIAAPSRNTAPRSSSAGSKRAFGLRTRVLVLGACLFPSFAHFLL